MPVDLQCIAGDAWLKIADANLLFKPTETPFLTCICNLSFPICSGLSRKTLL